MKAGNVIDSNAKVSLAQMAAVEAGLDPDLFKKKSFLGLPVAIDKDRLVEEFNSIPAEAWGVSHWDAHCSIDVLLLRGGAKGEASDFTTRDVTNAPVLDQLPYIASLLQPEGPFGGAIYAFIFRTKPNGITRVHWDNEDAWQQTFRLHVPIVSNDGAVLLAEGRSKHFPVGEVWTFDNQAQHSVVNGDTTRVHMIIDVDPNPKLAELLAGATFEAGEEDPARWEMTGGPRSDGRVPPMASAKGEPLTFKEKAEIGLDQKCFATRVTGFNKKAILLGTSLKVGDILTSVNGVCESPLSRTALDHIVLKHEPGETVVVDLIREGRQQQLELHLKPNDLFSPKAQINKLLTRIGVR